MRRQGDRFGVEPERQPGAHFGSNALVAQLEGMPAGRIKAALRADAMQHGCFANLLEQLFLERRAAIDRRCTASTPGGAAVAEPARRCRALRRVPVDGRAQRA